MLTTLTKCLTNKKMVNIFLPGKFSYKCKKSTKRGMNNFVDKSVLCTVCMWSIVSLLSHESHKKLSNKFSYF